jgi:maleate isomerase
MNRRIGLIVPSSNTTIETEVPEMLRRLENESFTFHSSRAVLHSVDRESLADMVAQSDRCANELADADVDAIVYACLIAVMAQGAGAHEESERRLAEIARARRGRSVPVVSSAGALVRTLSRFGARRVALMTPYVPALTAMMADYLAHHGIEVVDSVSLCVQDNLAVGRLDQASLKDHIASMQLAGADAVIASACVQMPSLSAVPGLEREFGLPMVTAATATVSELLVALGVSSRVPAAGQLLAGATETDQQLSAPTA